MKRFVVLLGLLAALAVPSAAQQCASIRTPWYENFDSIVVGIDSTGQIVLAPLAPCWIVSMSDSCDAIVYGELRVNMETSGNFIMALPPVALPADSVFFRFHVLYSGNAEIAYGVMTDSADTNTFVFFDSVPLEANNGFVELEFSTLGVNITGNARLAIKIRTSTYAYVWFDNFYIDRAAGCPAPERVWTESVDTTSVTLGWNYSTLSAGYVVTLDDSLSFYTTDTVLTIDSLEPNHAYSYTLQAQCYAGELTPTLHGMFRTACLPVGLPYMENFGGYSMFEMPECWQVLRGLQHSDAVHTVPSINHNGRLKFQSVTDTESLVITPMLAHRADQLHIAFDMALHPYTHMTVGLYTKSQDTARFIPLSSFDGSEVTNNEMRHYDVYSELADDTGYAFVAFWWHSDVPNGVTEIDNVHIDVADSCHNPTDVYFDYIGEHSVSLTWTDNSVLPADYEIRYSTEDNVDTASHIYVTANNYITIDSLRVGSAYWFWIRSLCGDSAEWVHLGKVRTVCGMPDLPYEENFESFDQDEILSCWDYYTVGNPPYPHVYRVAQYASSGMNVWAFQNPYNDTVMVVLPSFGVSARTLEVSFNLGVYYGRFEAGVYNPADNTFTPVETRLGTYDLAVERVVYQCDTVVEATEFSRVAFRWTRNSTVGTCAAYIDDLLVRRIPLCHPVDSVTLYDVADSSVTMRIHDSWSTGIYRVVYTTDTIVDTAVVYGNYATITGLQHSSNYTFEVRGYCTDGTLTDPLSSVFSTQCHIITHDDLPYFETFDSYVSDNRISPCWNRMCSNSYFTNYPIVYQGVNYGDNPGASMQFLLNYASGNGNSEVLVLPAVDYLNDVYLEFDVRKSYPTVQLRVGVMTNPNDVSTFFTVSDIVSSNYGNAWTHYAIPFNNYNGAGRYVAISAYNNANTYSTVQLYVDNVKLSVMPQCSDSLLWLVTSDVGESCASMSWDASMGLNEGAVYVVHLLDSAGVELYADTTNAQEYMFCNLDDGTTYYTYVDLYCGNSVAASSEHRGFTTRCIENTTIALGSTSGMNSVSILPFRTPQSNSSTEQIFRFTEMQGTAGTISNMALYCTTPNASVHGKIYGSIYLAHTSDTIIRQWIPTGNMIEVYTGPLDFYNGWNIISLSTPFHYNGVDNLVVAFETSHPDLDALNFGARIDFDSASMGVDADGLYYFQRLRNVIRFNVCPDVQEICAPPTITSATATDLTVTVNYASDVPCEVYLTRGWWNRGFVGEMDSTGSRTFTGLEPSTQYTVGVRKHCGNGQISIWSIRRVTTLEVLALPPTQIELEEVGYNRASVVWHPRATESRWELRLFNTIIDTHVVLSDTTFTFDNLLSRVTYNVSIRSLCGSDYSILSPWSDTLSFTTDYCHPVSGVTVSNVTMTSAHVSWTPSDNGVSWKVEYGYEGFQRGDAIASYVVDNATYIDFDTLEPGVNYNVFVAAICGPGMSSVWVGTDPFHTPAGAGITATDDGTGFMVYPNPASTFVNVKLDADDPEARIAIIDQQGRTVATSTGPVAVIDVSQLSAGIYFVRLSGTSYSSVKKLVVK